jgi:hypothetical protein
LIQAPVAVASAMAACGAANPAASAVTVKTIVHAMPPPKAITA